MGLILQDIRVGVRQLAHRPAFAAAAILSLALGIGAVTTLFTVVNAVLFKSSPLAEPDRLVEVYSGRSDFPQMTTSYPDYLALGAEVAAFQAVAAHAFVRGVLSTSDRPLLVTGEAVTANYFTVLGIAPRVGRSFTPEEARAAGAAAVAVVSHGLWQRQLGGRPDVDGSTVRLSGLEYEVIGVAPPEFPGTVPGIATDFWVPVTMVERLQFTGMQWTGDDEAAGSRLDQRATRWLFVKGRLAPGRTVAEARAECEALYARLTAAHPDTNEKVAVSVVPAGNVRFHPMLDGYVRAASAGLLAAVGLVLLIACANVAALLLARGTARRRELAVRAAVGAGRGRLVAQLLSEGLVLAAAGGVVGILLAWWAGRALGAVGSDLLPLRTAFDFSIDGTVLAVAVAVSTVTALIFGLVPAWSASRPDLVPALKDLPEGDGGRRLTLRDALVVGQLALSLVLLVAGALLARGAVVARGTQLGFDPGRIATLSFNLQMNGYDEAGAMAFRERVLTAVRALPGVTAAALATRLPMAADINMEGVTVDGHHAPGDEPTPIDAVHVGAGYFEAVGVPLVAGRAFTAAEIAEVRPVAVVNETFARTYWPERSAVGQVFHPGDLDQPAVEVIGVARDHKVRSVGEPPRPYLHRPLGRGRSVGLVVRTAGPAAAALPMLRDAVWQLEPDVVFTEEGAATDAVETTTAPTRIGAVLLAGLGALALLLAAVGLYGVVAYSVSLRTREVGIRLALGAERGQVLRMILRQGLRLALIGTAIGAVAAAAVGRVLESLLYGVSAVDPIAYAVAAAVLLVVAVLANLAPAIAASRLAPAATLRA
ncbi:MAG: ADOP family duplicated permease [Vicinamibacterales bacterium]